MFSVAAGRGGGDPDFWMGHGSSGRPELAFPDFFA